MPERIRFSDTIEPLVRFIEETPRDEILDRTLDKLRAGVTTQTMLTASALAVARSSDLPPGHHGGPLHPLAGLYAVSKLVGRLEGDDRFLPVLQHVALSNKHIHDPVTAPYSLLDFAPLDAGGVEATKDAFLKAANRGESNKADHLFLWLWQHIPPIEALDLLLTVAIPKNMIDDHYFIFPAYTWRAFEFIGQEYLPTLMRPAVRYVARFPSQRSIPDVDALIEEHRLLDRVVRQHTGEDETAVIGEIGARPSGGAPSSRNSHAAGERSGGRTVPGRGGRGPVHRGCRSLLAFSDRGSHGCPPSYECQFATLPASARRSEYAKQIVDTAALAHWTRGEVGAYRMAPTTLPDMAEVAALPPRTQEALLDAITQSIHQQPPVDWTATPDLVNTEAAPEVTETVNLTQQYVQCGYDAAALMRRLGEIVCHDNFTEMHAFKHHQAIVEEFFATREPWRGTQLVCGARAAAISFGKNMEIYEEAGKLLHAGIGSRRFCRTAAIVAATDAGVRYLKVRSVHGNRGALKIRSHVQAPP